MVQRKVVIARQSQRSAKGRPLAESQRATRSGSSSRKPAAATAAAAAAAAVEAAAAAQPSAGRKQRATRRASSAAACQGDATISDLSAETMHEIFVKLTGNQAHCRYAEAAGAC